jgi:hypothetical protein
MLATADAGTAFPIGDFGKLQVAAGFEHPPNF